jgi:hypothetical protein
VKRKFESARYFLLLLCIPFLQINIVFAQQNYLSFSAADKSISFSENFDNNSNKWITDNLWINGKIVNGYYEITCKNYNQSTGLSCKVISIEQGRDFEIEAGIKIIKGTGGLVFGMTDKFDHYRVEISDLNILEIIKDTPSKKKKVDKLYSVPSDTNILKASFNKVTIRSVKGIYYIFLNESLTGQFKNIKPEGNQIGFNVGTDSEISVDFLRVSSLKDITSSIITERDVSKPGMAVSAVAVVPGLNHSSGPKVTWISPSGLKTNLDNYSARVKANIQSKSGLKSVLLYQNGVSKGEAEIKLLPGDQESFLVEKTINFGPGENTIYLVATNNEGATKSELRYFTNPSAVVPVVTWTNPVNINTIVNTESFAVGVCIKSPSELKSVKLLVNGNILAEDNIFTPSVTDDCNYNWQSSVVLKDGDNSIYLVASNIAGSTTSEKRLVKYSAALAEKRLALIFGNALYKNSPPLKNPINDANLMEVTLMELGFDVIKRLNVGKDEMMAAIREFNERLSQYNVALFYYAGHGNQVDGKNFMIPIDARLEKPSDCRFEAIGVDFVVEEFERYPDNTNIVILDACRNNPYASWARGNQSGFKAMSFSSGTIIAFATSEGATAADGKGANGLFTEELVKQMMIPQALESVFKKTRVEVRKVSNGQQIPQEWSKLNGEFCFKK